MNVYVNIYQKKTKSICFPHSTDSYHAHPCLLQYYRAGINMGPETRISTIPRNGMKRPHTNAKVHILDHPLSME